MGILAYCTVHRASVQIAETEVHSPMNLPSILVYTFIRARDTHDAYGRLVQYCTWNLGTVEPTGGPELSPIDWGFEYHSSAAGGLLLAHACFHAYY